MKTDFGIDKIASIRIRNLLRGMLANTSPFDLKVGFQKITAESSPSDFKTALEVLRRSQLFRSSSFGRYFPRKFSKPLEMPAYVVSEIVEKINQNERTLVNLTQLAKHIMLALGEQAYETAFSCLKKLIEKDGTSIFVVRVAYLLKNRCSKLDLSRQIDALLENIQVGNVRYAQLAVRELSSPNTEYLKIREKISLAEDGLTALIAKSLIDHIPRNEKQFADVLNAYFSVSLFDAYLFYCSVLRCGLFAESSALNTGLTVAFTALASLPPCRIFTETDDPGLCFFKESLLLIELDQCYAYRTCHCALYSNVEGRLFERTPFENLALSAYFADVKSLQDVKIFSGDALQFKLEDVETWFEKTNALIYFLELNDGVVDDEKTFVELMSLTRDVGITCQKRYLLSMSQMGHTDEFKLVVACLAYIKSRTQLSEHELREVIQEIAIAKFDADVVRLLEHFYEISPSVTEHLIQVLDETFLTKLFEIIDRPNAAIEQRASIFEWYGNKIGDSTYLDRAKTLRIDVQINKTKGTIDDARIYVDPVRFTQWVTDNLLDELSILVAEICSEGEPVLTSLAWDKVKSGMGNKEQVAALLLLAYEEFCSNNKFGIASYVGRRIRHGTLKETAFNDVKILPARQSFAPLFVSGEFDASFREWIFSYEMCLNNLRDKYIQIQDRKKPDGLIVKDIRSSAKKASANHMLYEVLKSFRHNKSGQELPYIIAEYCWRLVEEDLASIRSFIMDQKAKHGVFRFDACRDGKLRQRDVQEFCQELNTVVADKFRLIESWFNKPSIASPSAELLLLFQAVLSEIEAFFPDFIPNLILDDLGYVIRGGTYFVIYDALYIIIYNAAKYGKKDGELSFGVTIEEKDGGVNFNITISSEIALADDLRTVEASIRLALEGDFEDALIFEGRSGIKKLKRMEHDQYIRNVNYSFVGENVIASFEFGVDYQS